MSTDDNDDDGRKGNPEKGSQESGKKTGKEPVKGPWGIPRGEKKNDPAPASASQKPGGRNDGAPHNPWAQQGPRRGSPNSNAGNSLDELIDAIQERIRNFISGGGNPPSGGSGGPRRGIPKGSWEMAGLIAAGSLAVWLGTGLYRVQEGEVGVVLRFGEMVRTSLPGLRYHLPAPFEAVIVKKVAVLNTIDGGLKMEKNGDSAEANLILTGDENMVHTNYTVLWKIKDVSEYLFTARDPESTIGVAAESVVREVIGQTAARLALTEGRGQIEIRAQEILQKLLDHYKMGIQVVSIQLQNVAPPRQVVDAFNDLQASLVNADQSRNEAEAYRNEIIPRAEGQAAQIANEAMAYSQRTIAEAQGEAGRFTQVLLAYWSNQAITLSRYYLETMQQVLSKSDKIILDGKVAKGMLPFLPLNDLKGSLSATAQNKGKGR